MTNEETLLWLLALAEETAKAMDFRTRAPTVAHRDKEKGEMNILISGPVVETARSAGLNTRHVSTEIYIQSFIDAGAVDTGAQESA